MWLGLMLAQREDRRVPAVGFQAAGIVQRDASVVTELRPGNAMRLIFVVQGSPVAGNIALRERGNGGDQQQNGADRPRHAQFRSNAQLNLIRRALRISTGRK
jgi:hypothetical protein